MAAHNICAFSEGVLARANGGTTEPDFEETGFDLEDIIKIDCDPY